MAYTTKILIIIWVFVTLAAGSVCADSVRYISCSVRGIPVNTIYANLDDPKVKIGAAIVKNGIGTSEPFGSFMQRLMPTAAVNGTFFSKSNWKPIGDIVISSQLVHFGGMGTGLCITGDNKIDFINVQWGHHTDWSKYETVICCGPRLITDSKIDVDPKRDGFRDSHVLGIGCRTAVGLTYRNRLLLLNTRKGCSLTQLANIMKDLGCTQAINFDGGASTAMYYRGKAITSPGRQLTNVLLVYER